MNEGRLTLAQRISAVNQIMCGHPLEHRGGGLVKIELLRNPDESRRWNNRILRITSQYSGIGDTIAGLDIFDLVTDADNDPRRLHSRHKGNVGGIAAFAIV